MNFVDQGHLGGYVPGGDEATYYPDLWTWLVDKKGIQSVLDVGAGDGIAVDFFAETIESIAKERGLYLTMTPYVFGVEGVEQPDNWRVGQHDYTTGPFEKFDNYPEFDLVWSCEFVEHVEEEFVPNFLHSFKRGKIVLMTHASPGQAGYHHVNCQPAKYWIDKMKEIGFTLDTDLTFKTRELASMNTSPWNHYVRSGLAFRRDDD